MTKEEQVTLRDIHSLISDMRIEMKDTYVTKDSFDPVRRIVYGLVALVLTTVVGALLATVVMITSRQNTETTSTNK